MKFDKNSKHPEESGPNWLVTFSDLMMIILVLFIVLISFSDISQEGLQKTVQSFKDRPVNEFQQSVGTKDKDGEDEISITEEEQKKLEELKKLEEKEQAVMSFVETFSKENGLQNELFANKTKRGIELVLPERMLFESGQANLLDGAKGFLTDIAPLLAKMENQMIVEGYTDNIPISNERFKSNWQLSTDRSISVIDYLANKENIEASRFTAVGYGEFKPIAKNDSEAGRKKNRRVVIIISNLDE
ncbi:OmpA family protein [Metabacillus fastidiosus]|uniref:OmpA family protein n=1 Tax=Metabacillus fastidiosus TaxID=1458 RepID=A0ABU6P3B7_9BACI|nr:OmpA family protein [Metabacillus fastidiosus]MED4403786.1 OmpA family protein [Metabacillus fastidiosus]MED4452565.1 OmpA family protein [Metabacillus fastidiosus]MED4463504.1 OmpA family protein [Metabacillus fastidiosus]